MKITPIPTATRDVLPAEADEIRFLESAIRRVFDSFGYGEVMTPTLELEAAIETAGEQRFGRSFRLFDERGEVLMLRPEMTTPIARLVATRMADREPPFRLCYFANSFRPTTAQRGRRSEFFQAGLELVGSDSPAVDAEVLAVVCNSLEACGLENFSIALGESSFFRALLDSIGITGEGRTSLFETLAARDMVELEAVVGSLDISGKDRKAILDAIGLRGGSEVLVAAKDLVRGEEMEAALTRLARTYYLVSRYGYASRIHFDLGILRNFDYYTGIVFEVLSTDLGFPLGGGGRYDGLLARFGRPLPAVGFAVGLDRLHIAVSGQGGVAVPGSSGIALVGGLDPALDMAKVLRQAGVPVTAFARDTGLEEVLSLAVSADLRWAAVPEGDGYRLFDARDIDDVACVGGEVESTRETAPDEQNLRSGGELLSHDELVTKLAGASEPRTGGAA
ncbi:MAG: ATP phosphoribosyltransferase regulatory subunit [Thermoleophilia bacterium]|nr:ATP phosphoribosyltransferase regulatory subunit [Thermoleophilia bacterium]